MHRFVCTVAVVLLPLVAAAQGYIPTSPRYPISSEARALKEQILKIAYANQTRTDNTAEVRAQIDPLIHRLISITPERTEPQKIPQVLGGWNQAWSDAPFFAPNPLGAYDLTKIYQVVFPGYYWNISRFVPKDGPPLTGFLRGAFGVTDDSLKPVVFTKDVFGVGDIPPRFDALTFAIRAEAGEWDKQPSPFDSELGKPQSPLVNAYVDDNFRVLTNPPNKNGRNVLFILVRISVIPSARSKD